MKKFNWRSRKFVSALVTVVLLGLGVESGVFAPVVTDAVCERVQCDAV